MSSEQKKPLPPLNSYARWASYWQKKRPCYPNTAKKLRTRPSHVARCEYCLSGVIFVHRLEGQRGRPIPIEPASWDGSAYFIPRVHKFHGNVCSKWRKRKGMPVISEYDV